jgi:hypothetical protein
MNPFVLVGNPSIRVALPYRLYPQEWVRLEFNKSFGAPG